jgi:hypothetical protein
LEGLTSIDKNGEEEGKDEKVTKDETIVTTTAEVPVATPTYSKQPKCAGLTGKSLKKCVGKEPYVTGTDQLNISEQFRPKTNDIQ